MESKGWNSLRRSSQANWTQARADYATSATLLDAGIYYASVFFSQQAAEKAMRAATIEKTGKNPRGHNLIQMADRLNAPIEVMNCAAQLNSEFLATRNPEASDGIPSQSYDRRSARLHLAAAQLIVDWIKTII